MTIERQLTQASIALLLEQPFFGYLLGDMLKEADGSRTRSISIRYEEPVFVVSVCPDFWRRSTREVQMGHLLHQLLHLVCGHLHRAKDFSSPFLFNLAADLQVNEHIPESWLWEGALMRQEIPGLPSEGSTSLSRTYEQLADVWNKGGLRDLYEQREALFESHRPWFEKNIPAEMARWSAQALLRQAGPAPGGLPLAIKLEWEAAPVQINWRRLIRQFAQTSRSTFLKETIHRPSKRYGSMPGVRVRRRQRLLVAVDTSGSVSKEEQEAFLNEIHFLSRTSAEVTLLEFDAEIRRVYPYRGQLPAFLIGGGGTNFLPVLEFANAGDRWDGVIIFTDGFAPIPRVGMRMPVLWVITAQGLSPLTPMYDSLPGQKLKLGKNATFEA